MFDVVEAEPFATDEAQITGPASVSLFGLAREAGEVANATVETFAIITIAALLALGAAVFVASRGRGAKLLLAVSGLVALLRLLLVVAVGAGGDGGAIGDLGYADSFRVVAIGLVAGLGAATAFTADDVTR